MNYLDKIILLNYDVSNCSIYSILNIEQKNNNAYLPKDEGDESKPEINEEDPDGDGWWG